MNRQQVEKPFASNKELISCVQIDKEWFDDKELKCGGVR